MTTTPEQLVVQPLTSDQLDRLSTFNRFLINMGDRKAATQANRYGYNGEAHAKGHELYRLASGAHRPFEHFLAKGDRQIAMAPTVHKARLRRIDTFENEAFPTVENSMRAELAPEAFERVRAAFFDGLHQQPEGPDVVPGVRTFINRLNALRQRTDVPKLDAFFKDIEKKGITPDAITEVEKDLEAFEQAPLPAPPTEVSEEQMAALSAQQLEAYEKLNAWYIGWAAHLRAKLPYHTALKLGLTAPKMGKKKSDSQTPSDPA